MKRFIPNSPIEDICPEENFQKDDHIVIPQDDLYYIAWESNFGDLPFDRTFEPVNDAEVPNDMISVPLEENRSENLDPGEPPVPPNQNDENLTLRPDCLSKENLQNSPNFDPNNLPEPEPMDISPSSSRGGDTTVPSVSNSPNPNIENTENTDIEQNEDISPRGTRYNLRPNPNPNYSEDFRY